MSRLNIDRTNSGNTGKLFERELELLFHAIEVRGLGRIRKVDPPTRTFGSGFARRVVHLENPFLDYVGAIGPSILGTSATVLLEAKSTATHRLPLGRAGGLTEAQFEAAKGWARAGATVGVLWRFGRETRFFPYAALRDAVIDGEKSLSFEKGHLVTLEPAAFLQVLMRAK